MEPSERVARLGALADPDALHSPIDITGQEPALLTAFLKKMILIRAAEEKIGDNVANGTIRCPCHLAIGQEAVPAGVSQACRKGDRSFGAHRSHGHFLALGGSVHALLAEVLGKDTGASRGMGGSMHLLDVEHGLYGTVPIVGATIPIAVGAALAAKMERGGAIAISYFGDGATEEGGFHESMNLASALNVPVLFVSENNLFSSHLHIDLRQPADSVSRYAEAHRIPWARVDGNDVVAVHRAASSFAAEMRAGGGPRFIEAITYRWRGHVGPREDEDVGVKRKDDLHLWKMRDPVRRLSEAMTGAGLLMPGRLAEHLEEARLLVEAAWERARNDPFPSPAALLERVYFSRKTES